MNNALELYEFIDKEYPNHLTLGHVLKMKIGNSIKVVVWDRNVEEYGIWEHLTKEQVYNAEEFFKWNVYTLVYQGGVTITLSSDLFDEIKDTLHVDVTKYNIGWKWIPLKTDGTLVISDSIAHWHITDLTEEIVIPHCDIHLNTRVGWRGPIILYSHLKGKKVFYST